MPSKHQRHLERQRIRMGQGANGDGTVPGIPPDLEWSDDLVIYGCSHHIEHARGCDGTCEENHPDELQVSLLNEGRAWRRLGMDFRGIPAPLMGGPYAGVSVEIWDLQHHISALEDILVTAGIATRDELDDKMRETKLQAMRRIREQSEEMVRRARMKERIAMPQKPGLLGPDGNPI